MESDYASTTVAEIAYSDVYRDYLGMRQDEIDLIPWYRTTYGISDDDCLSIAVIAHAAYRPFAGAVQDFNGPCHHRIDELMRWYSVPSDVLFVDVPAYTPCPPDYRRLYEPYWDGRYRDNVCAYSNYDCWSLISFRISTEYRACPPPLFFDRVNACGSSRIAFQQQGEWWPDRRRHDHVFAPATMRRPATVVANSDSGSSSTPSARAPAVAVERVPATNHPTGPVALPRSASERVATTPASTPKPATPRATPANPESRPDASESSSGSQSGSRPSSARIVTRPTVPLPTSASSQRASATQGTATVPPREYPRQTVAASPSPSPTHASPPPSTRAEASLSPSYRHLESPERRPQQSPQEVRPPPPRPADRPVSAAPTVAPPAILSGPHVEPNADRHAMPMSPPSSTNTGRTPTSPSPVTPNHSRATDQ